MKTSTKTRKNTLTHTGIAFEYEKPLTLAGVTRCPDLTIVVHISGRTIFWEHLRMLERVTYRQQWDRKLSWYRANGVIPVEEGGDPKGLLVTATELTTPGFNQQNMQSIVNEYITSLNEGLNPAGGVQLISFLNRGHPHLLTNGSIEPNIHRQTHGTSGKSAPPLSRLKLSSILLRGPESTPHLP